ncbi:MAG: ferritin-like domain-containing protein [Chloroflexi bacterium]|nr:ferritin-like domain-containing protein [Chloroflexota bacterium]
MKAAMDNEQQHVDDLKVRIEELRGVTSRLGFAFHMAGGILGFSTSVLGKKVVLKADIRLEERAVKDYSAILQKVPFDDRSRVLVEKNLEDEKVHIKRWQDSLVILRTRRGEAS